MGEYFNTRMLSQAAVRTDSLGQSCSGKFLNKLHTKCELPAQSGSFFSRQQGSVFQKILLFYSMRYLNFLIKSSSNTSPIANELLKCTNVLSFKLDF